MTPATSPIMISPVLSSTASSVASSDSVTCNNQSFNDGQQLTYQQGQYQQYPTNNKRNFAYMNDESSASVASHDDDNQRITSDDSRGRKPGRKPMADDEECDYDDEDPKTKRKSRNRAAQRAFRERKERYVKELEKKIKYVQDSHIYATTQLFQENQHLRSIIYKLEMQLGSLKGLPVCHSKSWSSSFPLPLPPSPPPFHFNSFVPLQIRPVPSPIVIKQPRNLVSNIAPGKKKQKKEHIKPISSAAYGITTSNNNETQRTSESLRAPYTTKTIADQQFTLSIITPDNLRASTQHESLRKNEQIQAVPLYPDQSHPANSLLPAESKKAAAVVPTTATTTTPALSPHYGVASSVINFCTEEKEEKGATVNQEKEEDQGFNDILKLFLDTRGNFDFSAFNNVQTEDITSTSSSSTLILNQLLEEAAAAASSSNNNNDWSNLMETTC